MRKTNFLSKNILFILVLLAGLNACEEKEFIASDIRETISVPVIKEFSPVSGSAGHEILITGENLATVYEAYIGGVETKIKNRISNTQILLEVIGMEVTGAIKMINNKGEALSSQNFTVNYTIPAIASILPVVTELWVGDTLLINGSNLEAVVDFYLGEGKAEVLSLNDTKAVILVPYILANAGRVRLEYYAPGEMRFVESTSSYNILKTPSIISCPNEVEEGTNLTITGADLDVVSKVWFGSLELSIVSQTFNEIIIQIPDHFDTNTEGPLVFIHNTDKELVVKENLLVTVPK